jgi:hypothetical protein
MRTLELTFNALKCYGHKVSQTIAILLKAARYFLFYALIRIMGSSHEVAEWACSERGIK